MTKYIYSYIFFVTFFISFLFYGIYPDEVSIQATLSDFSLSSPFKNGLHPSCLETLHQKVPLILYPSAITFSIFNFIDNIYFFRIFTIILLMFFLLMQRKILEKITHKNISLISYALIVLIFLSGPRSLVLGIFRPEILVLLFISFLIILSYKKKISFFNKILAILMFQLCIYIHPLVIFFLPILVYILRKNMFFIVFIVISCISSLVLFKDHFFSCSDVIISSLNASFNINPLTLFSNPQLFFRDFIANNNLSKYIDITNNLIFRDTYNSVNYLPRFNTNYIHFKIYNLFSISLFIGTFIITFVFTIINTFNLLYSNSYRYLITRSTPDLIFYFLSLGSFSHFFLNKTNTFYNSQFWYILFLYTSAYYIFNNSLIISYFGSLKNNLTINKFINMRKKIIFITALILHVILIDYFIHIAQFTGPTVSFKFKNIYSSDYLDDVKSYYLKNYYSNKEYILVDDFTFFLFKKYISHPILITYYSIGDMSISNLNNKIKLSIARCSYINLSHSDINSIEIPGPYGINNICFKEL